MVEGNGIHFDYVWVQRSDAIFLESLKSGDPHCGLLEDRKKKVLKKCVVNNVVG